jgi:hypothetical protein
MTLIEADLAEGLVSTEAARAVYVWEKKAAE